MIAGLVWFDGCNVKSRRLRVGRWRLGSQRADGTDRSNGQEEGPSEGLRTLHKPSVRFRRQSRSPDAGEPNAPDANLASGLGQNAARSLAGLTADGGRS